MEGIKYGARGFLLKDVSLNDLTRAIRDVAAPSSTVAVRVAGEAKATAGIAMDEMADEILERLPALPRGDPQR